jgi:protein-disulfide isomerase
VKTTTRRQFSLVAASALGALGLGAGCGQKVAKIPTRPAPHSSAALGPDLEGEILDTEDGAIVIDKLDPQQGPREAHCVVVVFSDFQCPFCRDSADILARIRKDMPTSLRLVFKHAPMSAMHAQARNAALASQVVFLEAGTDAFWRFHDRAFAHQREIDELVLAGWARDEGVRAEAIVARSPEAEKRIAEDIALAERLSIHGTPHFYVNARSVAGAYPYDQMKDWVSDEL